MISAYILIDNKASKPFENWESPSGKQGNKIEKRWPQDVYRYTPRPSVEEQQKKMAFQVERAYFKNVSQGTMENQ